MIRNHVVESGGADPAVLRSSSDGKRIMLFSVVALQGVVEPIVEIFSRTVVIHRKVRPDTLVLRSRFSQWLAVPWSQRLQNHTGSGKRARLGEIHLISYLAGGL